MVFVVMAVQYNSFIEPLVIMLTVPLALAGDIVGLYITNTVVGATVLVGAVLMVGIVVNNAIVMLEFANQIYIRQLALSVAEGNISRYQAMVQVWVCFPWRWGWGKVRNFYNLWGWWCFLGCLWRRY